MNKDDCNWHDRYEFAFDDLMKLKLNKKKLAEKECFKYLNENKDKCSLEWPLVKYYKGIGIPERAGIMLLSNIVYMWKNNIKLPEAIEYYVYEALDSVVNGNCSFEEAFFLKFKGIRVKEYAILRRRIINYIYTRVSIVLTLNEQWVNLNEVLRNEKGKFYNEISEELNFICSKGNYIKNNGDCALQFDCSIENVKEIIRKDIFNTSKFLPLEDASWDDGVYRENIEIYKSYLKSRMCKKYDIPPLRKKEAEKRLNDLNVMEEYLNTKNNSQTFEDWIEFNSLSNN